MSNLQKILLKIPVIIGIGLLMLLNIGGTIIWIKSYLEGKYVEWWVFVLIMMCGLASIFLVVKLVNTIWTLIKTTLEKNDIN